MIRLTSHCLLLSIVLLVSGCTAANWSNPPPVPSVPETVEARKFLLVDPNGKPLAELGAAHGGSGLVLLDAAGKPRAAMVLTSAGEPGVKLYDAGGVVRAALMVANDGRSGLAIYDSNGRDRVALATDATGTPTLVLLERDGRVAAVLPGSARGTREHQRPRR
jgi:hypothetical protein